MPVVGEHLTIFKVAMRSRARVMSPSSSLLKDPFKLDFTGRQILVMLNPRPSTFLAVLPLIRHPFQCHPSENPYNREEPRKIKFCLFFSGSLAFNKYALQLESSPRSILLLWHFVMDLDN